MDVDIEGVPALAVLFFAGWGLFDFAFTIIGALI